MKYDKCGACCRPRSGPRRRRSRPLPVRLAPFYMPLSREHAGGTGLPAGRHPCAFRQRQDGGDQPQHRRRRGGSSSPTAPDLGGGGGEPTPWPRLSTLTGHCVGGPSATRPPGCSTAARTCLGQRRLLTPPAREERRAPVAAARSIRSFLEAMKGIQRRPCANAASRARAGASTAAASFLSQFRGRSQGLGRTWDIAGVAYVKDRGTRGPGHRPPPGLRRRHPWSAGSQRLISQAYGKNAPCPPTAAHFRTTPGRCGRPPCPRGRAPRCSDVQDLSVRLFPVAGGAAAAGCRLGAPGGLSGGRPPARWSAWSANRGSGKDDDRSPRSFRLVARSGRPAWTGRVGASTGLEK